MLIYAGHPLLFPDAELCHWLARNQDLVDSVMFAGCPPAFASARQACRSQFAQNKGLGLPVPNWPDPPKPRLNTLYWPTGATRWAQGWFLATKETKDKIVAKAHSGSQSTKQTLGIGDDLDNETLSPYAIDMYLLPPRPITKGDPAKYDLWLIPLVDERYFWQFKDAGDLSVTTSTSWATLFSTLGSRLGVTVDVVSSVASAYLKPDPTEFTRRWDNAALLLDAAALSTGKRIIRRINGTVRAESTQFATQTLDANLDRKKYLLAGGEYNAGGGAAPNKVLVTFRKIKQHLLRSNGQLHTVENSGPSQPANVLSTTATIHCAAYADYNTSDVLQNGTALDALAAQIKTDFYGWHAKRYDYTFKEIQPWDLCGYDDCVIWTFGRPAPSPHLKAIGQTTDEGETRSHGDLGIELLAHTRVQSLPLNFWSELNAASDPDKELFEPTEWLVKNATGGDIAINSAGTFQIWTGTPGSESDSGKTVVAYNKSSAVFKNGKFGSSGILNGEFYVIPWQQ